MDGIGKHRSTQLLAGRCINQERIARQRRVTPRGRAESRQVQHREKQMGGRWQLLIGGDSVPEQRALPPLMLQPLQYGKTTLRQLVVKITLHARAPRPLSASQKSHPLSQPAHSNPGRGHATSGSVNELSHNRMSCHIF